MTHDDPDSDTAPGLVRVGVTRYGARAGLAAGRHLPLMLALRFAESAVPAAHHRRHTVTVMYLTRTLTAARDVLKSLERLSLGVSRCPPQPRPWAW